MLQSSDPAANLLAGLPPAKKRNEGNTSGADDDDVTDDHDNDGDDDNGNDDGGKDGRRLKGSLPPKNYGHFPYGGRGRALGLKWGIASLRAIATFEASRASQFVFN